MKKETYNEYIRLANHHFSDLKEQYDGDIPLGFIKEILILLSAVHKAPYWRRIRRGMVVYLESINRYECATEICMMTHQYKGIEAANSHIIKKISDSDIEKILTASLEQSKYHINDAVMICSVTGCRPWELDQLYLMDDDSVFIKSAKKRDEDDRGLDRQIMFADNIKDEMIFVIKRYIDYRNRIRDQGKASAPYHLVQNALYNLTKSLWPRRKRRPTLKTLRHQFSSNCKYAGVDRTAQAYIMGHRVTESAGRYGSGRSGRYVNHVAPAIPLNDIMKLVDRNHSAPPLKHANPTPR